MPASWRSCRPTRRPWAGPSCAAAWRPSSGRTGRRSSRSSTRRPRSPPRWARCIARPCPTAARSPAKLQYPDMASALEADLNQLKLVFAIGQRFDPGDPHRRDPGRDHRRACARSSTTAARPSTWRSTATCCATRPDVHVPEIVPVALDRPAAHHELARRASRCSTGRSAVAGGERRARHQHVPRLVRAVLFLRRDPRRSASRQLHGAARRLGQPDGFRLRAHLPAAFRARLDRALSRADDRRPRPRRGGLRGLGLYRPDAAR